MTDEERVDLEWGLRQSFIAYVERLPDGVVQATEGAVRDRDVFRLPGRRLSPDGYAFDGALHFRGHAGVLDVTLAAIRIEAAKIWTDVAGVRIPIADLGAPALVGFADGSRSATRFDAVVLTDDGAALLGGVYSPGATAAPLTIAPQSHRIHR